MSSGLEMFGSKFLSTPSARRATIRGFCAAVAAKYFYPRPPRGGRPVFGVRLMILMVISIHALREEGDVDVIDLVDLALGFLSTPSARRATVALLQMW